MSVRIINRERCFSACRYIACANRRWEQEFTPIEIEFRGIPMTLDQSAWARVAYLGHDVDDAAVRRRTDMLAQEGIAVSLGGFRRSKEDAGPSTVALDLGRTHDARLVDRALSVGRLLLRPAAVRRFSETAGVLMARNLEMLLLAWRVRKPRQRLVYECLDVHRLLLGSGPISRLLRWLERRLLARTDLVVVSSPAFARDYFEERQGWTRNILLVENKVPAVQSVTASGVPRTARPIVIGWFGMLRCRRTLDQLAILARASAGRIEVVIAGIPSPVEFPDFAARIVRYRGIRYLGRYSSADLPALYGQVDYVWAIDYFEEGLNSDWLLPNRLYEGLAHGAVPIALRRVETGRWLARNGIGLLIDDTVDDLVQRLEAVSSEEHAAMVQAIAALPEHTLYQTPNERRAIVAAITGGAVA